MITLYITGWISYTSYLLWEVKTRIFMKSYFPPNIFHILVSKKNPAGLSWSDSLSNITLEALKNLWADVSIWGEKLSTGCFFALTLLFMGGVVPPPAHFLCLAKAHIYINGLFVSWQFGKCCLFMEKRRKQYFRAYLGSAGGSFLGGNEYFWIWVEIVLFISPVTIVLHRPSWAQNDRLAMTFSMSYRLMVCHNYFLSYCPKTEYRRFIAEFRGRRDRVK